MGYLPLRPRQETALQALRSSIKSGRKRLVMQAPTGFGKTRLAAEVVSRALDRGNRIVFTVPAISLIDQTVDMFWDQDIRDVGVIQSNHELTDPARPVQIASVQTLMRRQIAPHDVVIIDECHRWFKYYERWMSDERWKDVPFIGLSATPWTKGLGDWFDDLIVAGTIKEGIAEGWLSKYRAFAPTIPDLSKVRTVAGDYHEGDLSKVMDIPPLTADILDTWRMFAQGRPTFVFAVDRAHARHLQEQFERIGVTTGYIDAFTPLEDREQIRRKFESDEIEVVCNVGCLTTGVDWDVRCIVLARPTKSEMLYVQMIGRGLRVTPEGKPEKDHLLILDHTGTTLKLGLVSDIHHEDLDTRKKAKASIRTAPVPKPKVCPKCYFLKPARVHECPACGFKPTKQSRLEPVPGELMEYSPKGQSAPETVKRQWHAMLLHRAREKEYKRGWVIHKYVRRFHEEPPYGWANDAPSTPNEECLSWLMAEHIRYVRGIKGRKKHAA